MGTRGPLADPNSSESKRGRNTLYRRKASGSTSTLPRVEPPAFIKSNPAAMAFWSRHAPDLIAARRLQPLQADCFGIICEMAGEVRSLSEAVAAEGLLIETARGPRANPRVRLLRDARRDLLAACRGFGIADAASDARLPAEPPESEPSIIDKFRMQKQALSRRNTVGSTCSINSP